MFAEGLQVFGAEGRDATGGHLAEASDAAKHFLFRDGDAGYLRAGVRGVREHSALWVESPQLREVLRRPRRFPEMKPDLKPEY